MESSYELTRSELIAVFKAWYSEAVSNPEKFGQYDDSDETAISSANTFVEYLEIIRKK